MTHVPHNLLRPGVECVLNLDDIDPPDLPRDYAAHNGARVTIVHELNNNGSEREFEVSDGDWRGIVSESQLLDVSTLGGKK